MSHSVSAHPHPRSQLRQGGVPDHLPPDRRLSAVILGRLRLALMVGRAVLLFVADSVSAAASPTVPSKTALQVPNTDPFEKPDKEYRLSIVASSPEDSVSLSSSEVGFLGNMYGASLSVMSASWAHCVAGDRLFHIVPPFRRTECQHTRVHPCARGLERCLLPWNPMPVEANSLPPPQPDHPPQEA